MIELVAVVAELVDALDSKSSSLLGSVGSIPTDGIFKSSIGFRLMLFLYKKRDGDDGTKCEAHE